MKYLSYISCFILPLLPGSDCSFGFSLTASLAKQSPMKKVSCPTAELVISHLIFISH